jgi:hypothetical protein
MSGERNEVVTWANESARKRDQRWRRRMQLKADLFMWWHGFYWKVLHVTRLARPYSRAMCRVGLYRKYPDGRCMWCGVNHD